MASAKWYGNAFLKAFNKQVSWTADDVKVMLTTVDYVPNQDNHEYRSDVTNEVVGTGYTAGGQSLTTKTENYQAATNRVSWSAANVSWPDSTITARVAVIYVDTGVAGTSPLLGYVLFLDDEVSQNGTFELQWHVDGIFEINVD